MITAKEIGARLRAARKAKGWTQDQVGAAVGISNSQIARIERGDSGTTLPRLREISIVLDMDPKWLEEDEPADPEVLPDWKDLAREVGRDGQRRLLEQRRLLLAIADPSRPRKAA